MIKILISGDNTITSRDKLNQLITEAKAKDIQDIVRLDGKKLDSNQLTQATQSTSLFGSDRLIVIEQLHSHPTKKVLSENLKILNSESMSHHMIIWEGKKVTKTQAKKLSDFTHLEFKLSPSIFKFLDNITPGNQAKFMPQFETACRQDSPEFVMFMLSRHVRLLLQSESSSANLGWQHAKLNRQLKILGLDTVLDLHSRLHQMDINLKSGRNLLDTKGELELLLATI